VRLIRSAPGRERPKSGARERATGQTSQGRPTGSDSVSGSAAGPAPGVSSPAPEAREASSPILTGGQWGGRTYERGFVVGAIAALYASKPGGWAAATWVTANVLGLPLDVEERDYVQGLMRSFIDANNVAVERYRQKVDK